MQADELAYLQYTSGSTRFPRGVMITQREVLSNLSGIITEGMDDATRPTAVSPGCPFTMTWVWWVWCWRHWLHK